MAQHSSWAQRRARFRTWRQVRRALRAPVPTGFVITPEPYITGHLLRGQQLASGTVAFAGHVLEVPHDQIWSVPAPDPVFEADRQGFMWLEDLALIGDDAARRLAQDWLLSWIAHHGKGRMPGWRPDWVARRLVRWLNHADFVLRGLDDAACKQVMHLLGAQLWYLSRCWQDIPAGLARFEALAALVHGGLTLEGMRDCAQPAITALIAECDSRIAGDGTIPDRNPEELLDSLTLLIWAGVAIAESGGEVPGGLVSAIQRIAPVLRSLRHSDGRLARFHGGGSGVEGRLDHALAASGVTRGDSSDLVMGYARLHAARVSVLIDAAPPPYGAASENAHASTLSLEVTSGRRPILVSCGPGGPFGEDWQLAARSTPSQTGLCLDGYSSARVNLDVPGHAPLSDGPTHVPTEFRRTSQGNRFQGAHDGYAASHGLTHARTVTLGLDGRRIDGEDLLLSVETRDRALFDRVLRAAGPDGIPFEIRFHLHPDVTVHPDTGNGRVILALKSGETWQFLQDGSTGLTIEPSVYLEKGRLEPRATKQVVLSGAAMHYSTLVKWALAKTQKTADVTRDFLSEIVDPYE